MKMKRLNSNRNCLFAMLLSVTLAMVACGGQKQPEPLPASSVPIPVFDPDSAFSYIERQVALGPRIPGSAAWKQCADYLATTLADWGLTVTRQTGNVQAFEGISLPMQNIIASYKPESKKRILLCAHWDCRPWADNDSDPANHHTPVDGANDGASGVGVLLEIARNIAGKEGPALGVDIILFDVEDYGVPAFREDLQEDTWCLGSKYWSRTPHTPGYNARYGILLDMVGAPGATFYPEGFSREYAPAIVEKVWNKAHQLGYGAYFPKGRGGYVTDDHLPVNRIARIPCIDIIPMDTECEQSTFGPTWHTVNDNMQHIDRATLKAVGQTVMAVVYEEK